MMLAVQRPRLGRMRKPVALRGVPIGVFAINRVARRPVPRSKRGSITPGAISPRKVRIELRSPPFRSPSISSCTPTRSQIDGASRPVPPKICVIPATRNPDHIVDLSRPALAACPRRTSPPDSHVVGHPLTVVRSLIARPGRRVLSRSAEPKQGRGMDAALTRRIFSRAA